MTVAFFTDEETEAESSLPKVAQGFELRAACLHSSWQLSSLLSANHWMGNVGEGLSLPRLPSKNTLNPQEEKAGVNPDVSAPTSLGADLKPH